MTIVIKNKQPFVEGVCLNDLTKKIETPFYVYSQQSISKAYNTLKGILDTEIFFSVKANSNQAILSLMKHLGTGADVVSVGELERALNAGISSDKIIFEGVGKSLEDIKYAINKKIRQINIESTEELFLIVDLAKSINTKVNIGIRINPDIDGETAEKISTGKQNDKFGVDFDLLSKICETIKKERCINLKGISCHIGSQIHSLDIFEKVFRKMKTAAEIIAKQKIAIEFLDLGGGFFVDYNYENEFDLKKLSQLVKKIFINTNYKISFEPGRYLVAKSGVLITKILTCKTNGAINYLITDAGMQTFLRPALYNVFHKIIALEQNDQKKQYTVAGPICETSDILANNIYLPLQKTGNYLAICDVGAYGFVMASNYNSRCLPAEILIDDDKYAIIRNKENISKIIEKDIIPDWLKH